jgi:hypothetical protein
MDISEAFELLQLDWEASAKEAKRAYLRGVKRHRPERDPEGFARVRAAYERIKLYIESERDAPAESQPLSERVATSSRRREQLASLFPASTGSVESVASQMNVSDEHSEAAGPSSAPSAEADSRRDPSSGEVDSTLPTPLVSNHVEYWEEPPELGPEDADDLDDEQTPSAPPTPRSVIHASTANETDETPSFGRLRAAMDAGAWDEAAALADALLTRALERPSSGRQAVAQAVQLVFALAENSRRWSTQELGDALRDYVSSSTTARSHVAGGLVAKYTLAIELAAIANWLDEGLLEALGQALREDDGGLVQRYLIAFVALHPHRARPVAERLAREAPTLHAAYGHLLTQHLLPDPTPEDFRRRELGQLWGWVYGAIGVVLAISALGHYASQRASRASSYSPAPYVPAPWPAPATRAPRADDAAADAGKYTGCDAGESSCSPKSDSGLSPEVERAYRLLLKYARNSRRPVIRLRAAKLAAAIRNEDCSRVYPLVSDLMKVTAPHATPIDVSSAAIDMFEALQNVCENQKP